VEELDPLATFGPEQMCFGCGPHNAHGMRLRFWRDGDEVVTRFLAREGWEGPPGILHGGLQAALADELGAWTIVGLRQRFGLTVSLQLRYFRPARLDTEIEGRGAITEDDGKTVVVRLALRQDGKRILSGSATYTMPTIELAEKLIERPLPEAWR
jgi:acyl-coenzyme A thioesterase PaaI-like protein